MSAPAAPTEAPPFDPTGRDAFVALVARRIRWAQHVGSREAAARVAEEIDDAVQAYVAGRNAL